MEISKIHQQKLCSFTLHQIILYDFTLGATQQGTTWHGMRSIMISGVLSGAPYFQIIHYTNLSLSATQPFPWWSKGRLWVNKLYRLWTWNWRYKEHDNFSPWTSYCLFLRPLCLLARSAVTDHRLGWLNGIKQKTVICWDLKYITQNAASAVWFYLHHWDHLPYIYDIYDYKCSQWCMVLGQLPSGDNSPPDKNKAYCPPRPQSLQPLPTWTTAPRTTINQ